MRGMGEATCEAGVQESSRVHWGFGARSDVLGEVVLQVEMVMIFFFLFLFSRVVPGVITGGVWSLTSKGERYN